jgi:retinoblastoma-associated protein
MATYSDIKSIISYFALLFTIYKKFDSMLTKFEPTIEVEEIKKVGWLIYILAKNKIYETNRNIIAYTCLLIPLLELLLSSNPTAFAKLDPNVPLKEQVCNLLQIKFAAPIENHIQLFQTTILQIFSPLEFIKSTKDFTAIWDKDKLKTMIKTLNKFYDKLPAQDIDETVFVKEVVEFNNALYDSQRVINVHVTPIKLNVKGSPSKALKMMSPSKCGMTLNNKVNESSLEGYNIPCRTVFNELTPIASTISMNNWLQTSLMKPQFENSSISVFLEGIVENYPNIKELIIKLTDTEAKKLGELTKEEQGNESLNLQEMNFSEQINKLYFYLVEELLIIEEKRTRKASSESIVKSEEFHKGVFVAACETVFFVHRVVDIKFEDLLEVAEISLFGFWKIIPSLIRSESLLPFDIVHHFHELEKKIYLELAWKKGSPTSGLLSRFLLQPQETSSESVEAKVVQANEAKDTPLTAVERLFANKVLQLTASLLINLTTEIKITDNRLKEQIWETIKQCFAIAPELLEDRNIIHLVMCSIYGMCRVDGKEKNEQNSAYTFNNIIKCFLRINEDVKDFLFNMFHLVKLADGTHVNIIEFYNRMYLPAMHDPIFKIYSENCLKSKQTTDRGLTINSPLKDALPKKPFMHSFGKTVMTPLSPAKCISPKLILTPKQQTPKKTVKLTPRTQVLLYCSESPTVRKNNENRPESIKNYLKSQILERNLPQSCVGPNERGVRHRTGTRDENVAEKEKEKKEGKDTGRSGI